MSVDRMSSMMRVCGLFKTLTLTLSNINNSDAQLNKHY